MMEPCRYVEAGLCPNEESLVAEVITSCGVILLLEKGASLLIFAQLMVKLIISLKIKFMIIVIFI